MQRLLFILCNLCIWFSALADDSIKYAAALKTNTSFTENKGQWDKKTTFLSRIKGADAWILNDGGMLLDFYKITSAKTIHKTNFKEPEKVDSIIGHRVHFNWINGNDNLIFKTSKKHPEYYNYLIGKDVTKHATNVGLYEELVAENLYQGIDIRYYHSNKSLRYDLIVKPHANANQIKIQLKGATKISKDEKGNIIMHTSIGNMSMQDLYVYEKETNKQINCKWVINKGNELLLSIGIYDKSKTLIIDPLIYSTYLGGSNIDSALDMAVNNNGETFITGLTQSANFDFTLGAYQTSYKGMYDSYISKLNSTGSSLIFATYIGGSADDLSRSIKIDTNGNSYITGYTESSDFNATAGSFQTVLDTGIGADVFVTKLNSTGTALIYSTYIGGSKDDQGFALDVDAQNNAYITGYTNSVNFDLTSGAFQVSFSSIYYQPDVFITKLNSTGSSLLYSTLLGGSSVESGYDITVDSAKNAYVTGYTYSGDFDITSGSFQSAHVGVKDVFATKINAAGSNLIFSTRFGGYSHEIGYGITTDAIGNVYITGSTFSVDYPITSGAFQTIHGDLGSDNDCFVTKLNATGSNLLFSTFIGALGNDGANDIMLDSIGNIYITGSSTSIHYYTSPSAFQFVNTSLGQYEGDVIITKLGNSGAMLYSTYLGGVGSEGASSIAMDKNGHLFIAGGTNSVDFPITSGAYQTSMRGIYYDGFVTKFDICPVTNYTVSTTNVSCFGSNDGTATINYSGNTNGITFGWLPLSISSSSVSSLSPGTYTPYLTDSTGCTTRKSLMITEPPQIIAAIAGASVICNGQTATLTATGSNNFLWNTGAINDSITVSPSGTSNYSVIAYNGSCSDTAFITLTVLPIPVATITGNDSICLGQSTSLTASGGGTFIWSTGAISNSVTLNPTSNTNYSVIVSNGVCRDTAQVFVAVGSMPNALITGVNTLCNEQSTTLFASGGSFYNWNVGNTNSSITINPSINTSYSVIVSNLFGCKDTAFTYISVVPLPTVSIAGNTVICSSELLTLTANGVGDFLWNTGETTTSITGTPTNNTTYSVIASNSCGSSVDSLSVIVNPLPNIIVSNDTTIFIENSANLIASGGVNYNWLPSGLSCNTCSLITVSPSSTTAYTVIITGANGCAVAKTITVNVDSNFDIFIPDIFSPNGDGQNDVLYVRGLGIKELNFKLYDRLGEKIFETNDISKGWDGSFKGIALNNAVFVYELSATLINGSKINKHGDVTLIR